MDQLQYLMLVEPLRGGVTSSSPNSLAIWLFYQNNLLFGL